MRLVVALLLTGCASTATVEASPYACTDYDFGHDPQVACRPPPTVVGREWLDCDAEDGLRCCRYRDGACSLTLCRRDEPCTMPWFELAERCAMAEPTRGPLPRPAL